ncbi:AcrR family transcriptional regulator [Nocardia transvalensis]|uniref:AcrR family transcriptional regulator n=1 Tax=Nocardia transvalensis TaxID=37333 RepID=A0A7W9PJM9_9NOCA|nr:TetR/AcrR family transcriptional regulator [Nocardia transvalensis]MBB5917345.1 AcrR family transcriptional regulator [Nocardia transvalensis]
MTSQARTLDSRERLLLATEQLYAERGPGVSLRDIAVAAGQRNNSAVNYHFGSRDGLIEYVIDRRTTAMEEKRTLLLAAAAGTDPDLPALVRILVDPMLTVPYDQGSTHYARFLEQVRAYPVIVDWLRGDRQWSATKKVTDLIARHLDHLPARARGRRIATASTVLFALAADRERAVTAARPAPSPEEITAILIATLRADPKSLRPQRQ